MDFFQRCHFRDKQGSHQQGAADGVGDWEGGSNQKHVRKPTRHEGRSLWLLPELQGCPSSEHQPTETIDDVWQLGKPHGTGGPWKNTKVEADTPSDPYLMTAYDKKSLTLSSDQLADITVEIDLTGEGRWVTYAKVPMAPGKPFTHTFPDPFSAYWIRFSTDRDCTASATLRYE